MTASIIMWGLVGWMVVATLVALLICRGVPRDDNHENGEPKQK